MRTSRCKWQVFRHGRWWWASVAEAARYCGYIPVRLVDDEEVAS